MKCEHSHITLYERLHASATYYQPAEYEHMGQCDECGDWLDPSDFPEEAEVHEARMRPLFRNLVALYPE
jgi:hypothetical protein